MTKLPEHFRLPDSKDYDDVIKGMDEDIEAEGGASLFLGLIRYNRRSWRSFNNDMLYPAAMHGLAMEERDTDGDIKDNQHAIANVALTGMIFGHVANEAMYPMINRTIKPYRDIFINESLLDESEIAYREAGEYHTPGGRQIGYSAMAAIVLNQLNIDSVVSLHRWSLDMLDSTTR